MKKKWLYFHNGGRYDIKINIQNVPQTSYFSKIIIWSTLSQHVLNKEVRKPTHEILGKWEFSYILMYNIKNIELLLTKWTEKRLHHPFHIPNIIRPISITFNSKFIPKVMIPQIFWRKTYKICGSRISWILNEKDSFLVQNTSKNIKLSIFTYMNSSW